MIEREPKVASIEQVWRIGDWFERETFDMFGIVMKGIATLEEFYAQMIGRGGHSGKIMKHKNHSMVF